MLVLIQIQRKIQKKCGNQIKKKIKIKNKEILCHVPHFMCYVSPVTCPLSPEMDGTRDDTQTNIAAYRLNRPRCDSQMGKMLPSGGVVSGGQRGLMYIYILICVW